MTDTVRVTYIGSAERFSELPITGQQQMWLRGSSGSVLAAHATALIASGLFIPAPAGTMAPHIGMLTPSEITAIKAAIAAGSAVYPYGTLVARSTDGVTEMLPAPPPPAPPSLALAGSPLTGGTIGALYSFQLFASGGTAPYTYSVASGTLPAGVTLNASTGLVSGTPTTAATSSNIVLRVTDSVGAQMSLAAFTVVIGIAVVAPGAPTSAVATAGDGQASVAFTAPASNGGSAITGYRVTASTGQTATGAASPIVVLGLANGAAVTFTVAAQNTAGYGAESAASNSVTPAASSATPTTYGQANTHTVTSAQRVLAGAGRVVSITNNGASAVTATIYDHHTNSGRVAWTGSIGAGVTATPNARTIFGGYLQATSPNFTVVVDEA